MTTDSDEWFRQAQYDIGTAESLIAAERYPPVIFFCHLALEKALKALYIEKYNDIPEKTHSLVLLIDLLGLDPPPHLLDSLIVINRLGITGRYPHNLEKVLEQYTKGQTQKLVNETQEILTIVDPKVIEAVNFFKANILEKGIRIHDLVLFGSSSTGAISAGSDIDIAVISDDFNGMDMIARTLLTKDAELNTIRKYRIPLDIFTLTIDEYRDQNSLFLRNVRKGIPVLSAQSG